MNSIESGHLLSNLINDLMDKAKLQTSTFNFNYSYINLIETIQKAFSIVTFKAQNNKLSLIFDIEAKYDYILTKIYADS
jgi:signal transduction histidine kinase